MIVLLAKSMELRPCTITIIFFSAMTSTKGLFIDHLHPSSKGAEIIAKYFAEKFAPLIKEKLKIETNQ